MLIKSIKISCLLSIFFVLLPFSGITQEEQEVSRNETNKVEITATVKEELHRYIGYEELLPKYISLPYDMTMNTNVRGPFLDISYLFLIFLPILLLVGLKNNWIKLGVGIFMMLFLLFSMSTGYSSFYKISLSKVGAGLHQELEGMSVSEQPLMYLKLKIGIVADGIYRLIDQNIVQKFSGEGDYITYPFFFLLFIATFFIVDNRLKESPIGKKSIVYLGLIYSFLWLILGAGVVWYGILMMALGLVYLTAGMLGEKSIANQSKPIRYIFLVGIIVWLFTAYTYRLSNYNPIGMEESKGAIHQASLFYGLGKKNKIEVLDNLFPAYRPIIDEINRNPTALVYRAGTYFQYFIERNNERIFHDNQLGFFNGLVQAIPDKVTLAKALKKTGYEYLIIDLNLATIDKTPDQSLTKKTALLQEFLIDNQALQFIGTDRVIQLPDGQYTYGLSGGNIQNFGTFMVFKIK